MRWEHVDVAVEQLPEILRIEEGGSNTLSTTIVLDLSEKTVLQEDIAMGLLCAQIRTLDTTDVGLKTYTQVLLRIGLQGKCMAEFEAADAFSIYVFFDV